ncbi:relaxase/mobilization nuclease domain-containing protein [Faecalibaculum rodentium]|uniref:relaxase/mobilization nuclease domain-containing protein n=1 Tax=Faecalibaculum rodentium TaxID=1702221 RepID=UPI001C3D5697|nr:relaxase/mobilization nuclease domain-containing protein [Faecalibaculum rodentium]
MPVLSRYGGICHRWVINVAYVQSKFHNEQDERVAYHVVQSFDIRDNITPEMANEIGLKLCKEIYTDYQCVVCTHVDRGHLHNHIIINATNLSGRKLEDRLANKKEGLYGLRESSDRIAKSYGCHVMDEMKAIGRFKGKNYEGKNESSYEKLTVSWKSIIIDKIEKVKAETNSLDELLENLALEGYEIKRGKYIKVKPFGKL